jgi:hypothetical protein
MHRRFRDYWLKPVCFNYGNFVRKGKALPVWAPLLAIIMVEEPRVGNCVAGGGTCFWQSPLNVIDKSFKTFLNI